MRYLQVEITAESFPFDEMNTIPRADKYQPTSRVARERDRTSPNKVNYGE